MEQVNKRLKTRSRERFQQIEQQQKQIYNEFRITSFYNNKKFDLEKLKNKIHEVKTRQSAQRQRRYQSISVKTDYFQLNQPPTTLKTLENAIIPQNNPQSMITHTRPTRIKTQYKMEEALIPTKQYKIQSDSYQNLKLGKTIVSTNEALQVYEDHILKMWNLYELLSKIMQGVSQFPFLEQLSIDQYVDYVCSGQFEFIRGLLQKINPRYVRTIMTSRLLQHLSIFYLVVNLSKLKKIKDTHLGNFIGFASSNIVFLIRLYTLNYELKIQASETIKFIIGTINTFELESYKQIIVNQYEVIIRMEHNNQTMKILQTRLHPTINEEIQLFVQEVFKYKDQLTDPLFKHSKYIFQFLAYYLNKKNLIGLFNYLEMAPAPYLQLKFTKTIVIQPMRVLFFKKNGKIYIRAHTQTFLTQLSQFCNIIFWSDTMPSLIDPLLTLLPQGPSIYYLYRYHCQHQNGISIKMLSKIGCDMNNVIIIDNLKDNYKYNEQIGVEMPWKGQKKDKRLLQLLDLIMPLLDNKKTVRKEILTIRKQLDNLKKKVKVLFRKRYNNKHI